MEIVIENDPYRRASSTSPAPTYLRSPVAAQPHISTNSAFYYATLPRGGATRPPVPDVPDGAPTTCAVRRVDKSGLLEISELEVPVNTRPTTARLLAEGHGTISRRMERSGLLEAVPELPDQISQAPRTSGLVSEELLAAAATTRSMVERQQHLLGAETDLLDAALMRRRAFAASDSSQVTGSSSQASAQTESEPSSSSTTSRTGHRVTFAADEILQIPPSLDEIGEAVSGRLSKLSPRLRDRQASLSARVPDVIEAHGSLATPTSVVSSTSVGATSAMTSTTTTTTTTGSSQSSHAGSEAPRGERAEAEGCEHTILEGVEETTRLPTHKPGSAATTAKINHNDNIQALHVIILSEQL